MSRASIFDMPRSRLSLKRVAWAYGCAKKGGDDERKLFVLLLDTVRAAMVPNQPDAQMSGT